MQDWLPRILAAFHRLLAVVALLILGLGALFSFWGALLAAGSFYLAGLAALMCVYLLAWWVLGAFSRSDKKLRMVSFPPRRRRTPALAR